MTSTLIPTFTTLIAALMIFSSLATTPALTSVVIPAVVISQVYAPKSSEV